MESLIGGFKAYGFESAGEWQAFLHGARVTRTRVVPMIGVPYSDGKINRIRARSPRSRNATRPGPEPEVHCDATNRSRSASVIFPPWRSRLGSDMRALRRARGGSSPRA